MLHSSSELWAGPWGGHQFQRSYFLLPTGEIMNVWLVKKNEIILFRTPSFKFRVPSFGFLLRRHVFSPECGIVIVHVPTAWLNCPLPFLISTQLCVPSHPGLLFQLLLLRFSTTDDVHDLNNVVYSETLYICSRCFKFETNDVSCTTSSSYCLLLYKLSAWFPNN